MAQLPIPYGTVANDGTGIPDRTAFQRIQDNFTDLYSTRSKMISVGDVRFAGAATTEARVQMANDQALLELASIVIVGAEFLPFNVDQVTFYDSVKMGREGGIIAGGIWDAAAYGGKHSLYPYDQSYTIRAAAKACSANGGGTVNCQGFPAGSIIVLADDICGLLSPYDKAPITFVWGGHEVRIKHQQGVRSHHHHILLGGSFVSKDETGARVLATTMFAEQGIAPVTIATTKASGVVIASGAPGWARLEVGSPLVIHGRLTPLGKDNTTINIGGGIDAVTTSITVSSTTGFAVDATWAANVIRIEDELVTYSSKDGTHFLGCTRGSMGTTAASHVDTTPVNRVTYEPFFVTAITGNSLTLDHGQTMDLTASALLAYIGPLDVTFSGFGSLDGNQDVTTDDPQNPQGISIYYGREIQVGPGIRFRNINHGGLDFECCQDFLVDADFKYCGFPSANLGWGCLVFGRNKRFTIMADGTDCAVGVVVVDDRSVTPQVRDGPAEDGYVLVRRWKGGAVGAERGINAAGCQRCTLECGPASNVSTTGISVSLLSDQWVTASGGNGNTLIAHAISAPGGGQSISIDAGYIGKQTTAICYQPSPAIVSQDGVSLWTPAVTRGLTYGATVTPQPERGEEQSITVTDGVAFTIANPTTTQQSASRRMVLRITNSSGGAHGTITMGSAYRLEGGGSTLPAIANGKRRSFVFRWTSGAWMEESRNQADVG